MVLKGQLTLGELIAFRIISGYVIAPLLRLSNLYQSIQQTLISFERLGDILNTSQESTAEDKVNIPMKKVDGSIKIGTVLSINPNYLVKIKKTKNKYFKILLIGDSCFRRF